MKHITTRRFHSFYEILLLSRVLSIPIGLLVAVVCPTLLYWGVKGATSPDEGQKIAILLATIGVVASKLLFHKTMQSFPGARTISLVVPYTLTVFGILVLLAFFFRFEASRALLVVSGIVTLLWLSLEHFLTGKYRTPKLALLRNGETASIARIPEVDARYLNQLSLEDTRFDGVVADFQTLSDQEKRFLTQCALNRVAVYNARQVFESLTGRVKIDRMSENNIGALLPSAQYEVVKTVADTMLILLSAPIVLPLCLLTILAIRLESPGPAIYNQTRIGRGNKPFTIYKLRSMRFDRAAPEEFAGEADPRITKVGRIIRKSRIDELPQFINILKGEMSLIGPRPEQPGFVKDFDKKIPFYSYRHVVKPGISGWAQVRHGYAADTETTQVKIEHDLYYIKNCSFSLDVYIIFLTIRTMLSGFGAR